MAVRSRPENEAPTPAEKNRAPRRETSGDLVPQSTAQVPPKTKSSDTASSTNLPHSTVNTTRGAVARRPNPEAVRICWENRAGHIAPGRSTQQHTAYRTLASPSNTQQRHSILPTSPRVPEMMMEVLCPAFVKPLAVRITSPLGRQHRRPCRAGLHAPSGRHWPLCSNEAEESDALTTENRRDLMRTCAKSKHPGAPPRRLCRLKSTSRGAIPREAR